MSKWTLRVTAGEGRLTRRRNRILFVERHDPALSERAGRGLDIGMRELAGYAMTNESCPAFVFVDLDKAMLLAHGDPGLEVLSEDSSPLRSSSLGFVEELIGPTSILGCNHSPDSADTSLDEGTVPAGGFLLLGTGSMLGSGADDAPAAADSLAGSRAAEPAVAAPEATSTVTTGTEAANVPDELTSSSLVPSADSPPGDPTDDWDPWQRDPGIDLALIGSPTPAAPASAEPSKPPRMLDGLLDPALSAPTNTSDPADVPDVTGIVQTPPGEPAPKMKPRFTATDADTLPPIPGMHSVPPPAADTLREPINPDLRATVPANRRTGSPDGGSERAIQLAFDDGQVHTIRSGAIVGRNPTKEQVPAGFTAITVRSEHVSRRHWRIDFVDGRPTVFDLGSQAGTTIESTEWSRAVPTDGIAVQGDERIVFADRWATIERL